MRLLSLARGNVPLMIHTKIDQLTGKLLTMTSHDDAKVGEISYEWRDEDGTWYRPSEMELRQFFNEAFNSPESIAFREEHAPKL